jgi:hypothetical protein
LYGEHKEDNYSYESEDIAAFVTELQQKNDIAINRSWLDCMTSVIHSLKTSFRNQAMLCDYHARDAIHWCEEEQYE